VASRLYNYVAVPPVSVLSRHPSIGGGIQTAGGVDDRAPKARGRVAVGDETETPKASRGLGMGRGYPPPQPTRGSGGAS